MKKITEHMIFAAHSKFRNGKFKISLVSSHCMPLAFSHNIYESESGLNMAYEILPTSKFMETILDDKSISMDEIGKPDKNPHLGNIFTYSVTYKYDGEKDENENWDHLLDGSIRQSNIKEMKLLIGEKVKGYGKWVVL